MRPETVDDAAPGRVFVGRERELSELLTGFADAAAGNGRLFMIVGEPGIGKTRLALEVAGHAAARGGRILWGRCWEGGGAPAYWPWVQAIRAYVRQSDADSVRAQLQSGAAYLAHLVPELGARFPEWSAPEGTMGLDSEHARFQLFDAIAGFLRNARQPLVLILDDIHAADQPSLLLLHFVARELRDIPLLILATYRDVEVRRSAWRAELLGTVARESRSISLRGLSAEAVARFIAQSAQQAPSPALVDAVYQATEGNPFFVDEVVHLLVAEGRLQQPLGGPPRGAMLGAALLGTFRVPDAVREAIHRRVDPLSAAVREVLEVASIIGREFEQIPLQHVCGVPAERLLERLAEAVSMGVVIEVPGSVGRYAFSHALVRETLYDDVPPLRRIGLHRQIGEALELAYRADPEPHLAKLAHHFVQAATGGDAAKAISYAARAGQRALTLLAYEDAALWYQRALQVLDTTDGDWARRCQLLLQLAEAQQKAGNGAQARATYHEAARVARVLGAVEPLARAAVGMAAAGAETGVVDTGLIGLLEEALQALPDSDGVLRTAVLSRLAVALYFSKARERRVALSQEAVEMARRLGDTAALAAALMTRHFASWGPGNVEERLALATELLRIGEAAGVPEIVLEGHNWRIVDLLESGDVHGARADAEAYARVAEQLRVPRYGWHATLLRAMFALFEGRFTEGEQLSQEALMQGQRAGVQNAVQFFSVQTFLLHRERGRLGDLEEGVRNLVVQYPALLIWRCGLAFLYAELGLSTEAQREFERLATGGFANLPADANWLPALALLGEVCAFIGDVARAGVLYDLLLPHAKRNVVIATGVACYGSVAYYLGLLATTLSRWGAALEHFEHAIAAHTQMGSPSLAAYAQLGCARALVEAAADSAAPQSARSAHQAQAVALLEHVGASAAALGMTSLANKAAALERRATADTTPPRGPSANRYTPAPAAFRREGDYWSISFEGAVFRLKDAKGLRCLVQLLRHPLRDFHATELDGEAPPPSGQSRALHAHGDAGEILDRQARTAYRKRLAELREELHEAQAFDDLGRAAQAQGEIDIITQELAAAVGLGGRSRHAASSAERARVNVTRAIGTALRRIAANHDALGRYLAGTVKTGIFCSYTPDSRTPVSWDL